MKNNKLHRESSKNQDDPRPILTAHRAERNPELIEKFYKQIINSFGYAYPAKM